MNTLCANESLPSVLPHIAEPTIIVDDRGAVLGKYIPDPERVQRSYGRTDHLPSLEELDRLREAGAPGRTLREIFEHLLSLATTPEDRADLEWHLEELSKRKECPTA
jgi:hypothetical protein